ncbi:hypothetical protein [Phenylobacterium sp.]|uniref:hypothetical protein n=1 Tax=Phenylobacterium sp. TaxID=1871053 RepID=UPI0035B4368A
MALKLPQAVLRASADVLLDQVRLGRGPLDLVDALIMLAVTQANVEPVLRDPGLNRRYATYDSPPPEAIRRPISINAVAQSLGIPFETARRRVARLALVGVYRTTPAGVIVPGWVVRATSHRAAAEAGYARAVALFSRLASLGFPFEPSSAPPWEGAPPLRAVARASAEYLLRLVGVLSAELGDVVTSTVWLELLRSTHEHLPLEAGLSAERQQPASAAQLARRLGLPAETVRRRVGALAELGLCDLSPKGATLPVASFGRRDVVRILRNNQRDLARMFTTLGQLGIVAMWRADGSLAA